MRESRLWNVSPTLPARHSPRITRSRSPDLAHPSLPVAGRQCPPPRRVSLFSPSPAASQPLALRSRCLPAGPRPPEEEEPGQETRKGRKAGGDRNTAAALAGRAGGLCPGRRQHCQDTPGTRRPFTASLPQEPRGKRRCRGTRRCAGLYLCPPQPPGTPRLPRQGPGALTRSDTHSFSQTKKCSAVSQSAPEIAP